MIALVLERAGLDPTAVIGGRLSAFGSNARLGQGDVMVAEADESDRSFLMLWPSVAVITNIDHEHMENYGTFADLQQAFADFANKVPFYGGVVACADDPSLAAVFPRLKRKLVTYGLTSRDAQYVGSGVELGAFGGRCFVERRTHQGLQRLGMLELVVPGRHNLQNALAAVAAGELIGLDFARIADALRGFHGAERRFERHGEAGGVLVVDDYGHHPTEIAAVLAAARATLGRRLVVAFQPHRYSRTQQQLDQFGPSLREADEIVLADIYAASEEPIPGITVDVLGDLIARSSGRPVHIARQLDDVVTKVLEIARPGDAVLTLGAGSIGSLPKRLIEALRDRTVSN
jgi:UDP-N-acetylmuramate--alanine ligase